MLTNSVIMPKSKKAKVFFFTNDVSTNIWNRKRLKIFIEGIFKKEGKKLESIIYIFCTDSYLLKINRDFLNHDFYTDIITFNLSERENPIVANVFISIDRVRYNAKSLGTTINEEIHRVIFHGALHLCGYNDKSSTQLKKMRERENHYIKKYFD